MEGCKPRIGFGECPSVFETSNIGDDLGFQVAIELLRALQRKGTKRLVKLCVASINAYQTSPKGVHHSMWMKGPKGSIFCLALSPNDSIFLYVHLGL